MGKVRIVSVGIEVGHGPTEKHVRLLDTAPGHNKVSLVIACRPSQQHGGIVAVIKNFGGDYVVVREGDARRTTVGEKTSLEMTKI